MRLVDIYIDALGTIEQVGILGYEQQRGNATYSFEYSSEWLARHGDYTLSGELYPFGGKQFAQNGYCFGFIADALPDRWGRRLIDKREQQLAKREQRTPRVFTDFDYLLQLDDTTRMGALRFREHGTDRWLGEEQEHQVPPLTGIAAFTSMAQNFEATDADCEWIENLLRQGSSLGGARPKANMMDDEKNLYIAKVPSINDDYDKALWEHFAHRLAAKAGIQVAQTQVLSLPESVSKHHVLLSRRFDRLQEQRIHMASAMTLTGLHDGDDAGNGKGYLNIADLLAGPGMANPRKDMCELYRRIAFNICIGNHDDHFRNHAFLLTANGWTLSPAYDLNPDQHLTQSLLINENSNESSLPLLLEAVPLYTLADEEAKGIIREVKNAVADWRKVAKACHISDREQERFAMRFQAAL